MRIRQKIVIALTMILSLMLVLTAYSLWSSNKIKNDVDDIQTSNVRAIIAAKAENEYTGAVLEIRRYIADGDEKYSKNFEEKLTSVIALEKQLRDLTPPDKVQDIEKLINDTEQYKTGVVGRLIPVLREQYKNKLAGNTEKANAEAQTAAMITRELTPFAQSIQKTLHTAVEDNSKLAQANVEEANGNLSSNVLIAMILSGIAIVISVMLSIFLTKHITTPVSLITGELTTMATGDFAGKIDHMLTQRTDEFGILAKALIDMKSNLKNLIFNVQSKAEQLSAASEQLTASSEQSAQSAVQVADSIIGVANGTEKQVNAVRKTLSVVEKSAADINGVAHNAQSAASISQQTATAAEEGGKLIKSAENQMSSVKETVDCSAQVVSKLGERSKQIGQIVDTISGIASQTNLLALNAAIEAARAGEQGRGFSVVAEEVRKLAEQSDAAAQQIAILISEIQQETDQAVTAMNNGTEEVKSGSMVVAEAGEAFAKIIHMVEEMTSQVREISGAASGISDASQDIVSAVRGIEEVTQHTAAETQTVSAATEEQTASMQEIAATSRSLSQMAEELQIAVSTFKV
ncbi:methyl-accepting chemotaxis protein [Sporomusa aerivorans]|uniref:methyl-accepting chemotaxis protein n=1 Tax=Sporomusa aerivorans TaxID=204936 RepID=UPI00352B9995